MEYSSIIVEFFMLLDTFKQRDFQMYIPIVSLSCGYKRQKYSLMKICGFGSSNTIFPLGMLFLKWWTIPGKIKEIRVQPFLDLHIKENRKFNINQIHTRKLGVYLQKEAQIQMIINRPLNYIPFGHSKTCRMWNFLSIEVIGTAVPPFKC